jgi:hypothetical protein
VLTFLIVVALLVALGGTTAGVVMYNSEKKKRLGSGDALKALPGDVLRERSLKELKVGDVLTLDGKDFLVEGVIEYDEDGHKWVGARVVDGSHVQWCVVGLERVGSAHVRLLEHATPEGLVERCRWWLYSASGDDTVVLEQWGADYRVLRGKKVSGDTIDLIPGS